MQFDKLETSDKPTILSLSWRDIKSPKSGGAEIFTHRILAPNSGVFRIISFTPKYENSISREELDGITYLRKGNIFTVIWHSLLYYIKNHNGIDIVIDQCNTHRFFTKFWVPKEKRIFLIFQLTREIWDYQMKFPFNKFGKITETCILKLNRTDITITESLSTKRDLISIGFIPGKIHVVPIGLDFSPWPISQFLPKEDSLTFIYVGRYAKYKGIDIAIEAFAIVKKSHWNTRLWIVGKKEEIYIARVVAPLCRRYGLVYGEALDCDVVIFGFVSEEKKRELQSRAQALLFPSVREGWGMIITEAAAVGTPSIVFDSPGCRDAVDYGKAGYLCKINTVEEVTRLMMRSFEEPEEYQYTKNAAYAYACQFDWNISTEIFRNVIEDTLERRQYQK